MRGCQKLNTLLAAAAVVVMTSTAASDSATEQRQDYGNYQAFSSPLEPTKESRGSCAGYLLGEATDRRLDKSVPLDALLADLLDRQGPDMRPMRDFRDFGDITIGVAQRAWQLMHQHASIAIMDRLNGAGPHVVEALEAANVSLSCLIAAKETINAAVRLDSWAIQQYVVLSSWGNFPPTGIYEGTYGDIGSFHGCVNVPENKAIGHAHYCTIAYRPVLPTRRNYELIIDKEPAELLNLFSRGNQSHNQVSSDAFTEILNHAQYSHYVYYKFGTCFPIGCSPFDVQRLARLLGRRNILMSGPVKCHSKYSNDYNSSQSNLIISTRDINKGVYIWKPHITSTQQVAMMIVGLISGLIVALTLVDAAVNRLPQLYRYHYLRLRQDRLTWSARSNSNGKNGSINGARTTCLNVRQIEEVYEQEYEEAELDANNNTNTSTNSGMLATKKRRRKQGSGGREEIIEEETTHADAGMHQLRDRLGQEEEEEGGEDYQVEGLAAPVVSVAKADNAKQQQQQRESTEVKPRKQRSLFMEIVHDCSIITNACQFFQVTQSHLKNDILCINGIRCITMSWIIVTHTMQYNDWSAFARTREIETHLKSLINQPLFNGSYLVDTFFLVSGLLTSFSSFKRCYAASTSSQSNNSRQPISHLLEKFSSRSYLIGRYLRLTPQVLFISLLFILLPLLSKSGGPHWYTITGEYSENCAQNWWVNLFYLQAFYRSDKMCNFVCWWISVDMFYHLFALALILLIYYRSRAATLNNMNNSNGNSEAAATNRLVWIGCSLVCLAHALPQAHKHWQLELPPNLLSTIPQTGAMWSHMTLELFWTPWAHAFPFFLGFYLGYLMAQHDAKLSQWFTWRRSLIGWSLAITILITQSYSTYFWVLGRWRYTRLVATLFHLICPITWSTCLAWIILACQYGYGTFVNRLLSCKLFIILGKASYIVYLSHFLVLFIFFGSQNLLLEPTQLVMFYVIIGNICLAMLLGCVLCICFEMPWLKYQRRLMRYVR